MSTSLEEERRALLERMRASREDCRSRFPAEPDPGAHHPQAQPLAHPHDALGSCWIWDDVEIGGNL